MTITEKRQLELNKQLAKKLKDEGISKLSLTCFGNSIAAGYSIQKTMPLVLRNKTLKEVFNNEGLRLERHSFARAQNNSDEHLYDWLITNISENEINELNRMDFDKDSRVYMPTHITDKERNMFFKDRKRPKGLHDAVLQDNKELANVVVYSGCTGSFLDNVTREGKVTEMLLYGLKRDIKSIEATLKYINASNRKGNSNTQVYLLGAPNILGLNITEIINRRLKKVAKQYPNVVYIEPVKSKFLYRDQDTNKLYPDIHYDVDEYNQLSNNIIESIKDNYAITKAMILLDRFTFRTSHELEQGNTDVPSLSNWVAILAQSLKIKEEKKEFLKQARKYLLERSPYDFYYVGKKDIKKAFQK